MRERRYRTCQLLLSLITANVILMSHGVQGGSYTPGAQRSVVRNRENPTKNDHDGLNTNSVQWDKRSSRVVGRHEGSTLSPLGNDKPGEITMDPEKVDTEFKTDDSDGPLSIDSSPGKGSKMQSTVHRNGLRRRHGGRSSLNLGDIYEQLISKLEDIANQVSSEKLPSFDYRSLPRSLLALVNTIIEPLEPAYQVLVKPVIEPLSVIINPIASREDLADFFDIFLDYLGPGDERYDSLTEALNDVLQPLATPFEKLADYLGFRPLANTEEHPTTVPPIPETTPEPLDIELSDIESFLEWAFKTDQQHETHGPTTPKNPANVPIIWYLNGAPNKNNTIINLQNLLNPTKNDAKPHIPSTDNLNDYHSNPYDSVSLRPGKNPNEFQTDDNNHFVELLDPANYAQLTLNIVTLLQKLTNHSKIHRDDVDSTGIFREIDGNSTSTRRHHGHHIPDIYRKKSIDEDGPPSGHGGHPPHSRYSSSNPIKPGSLQSTADLLSPYRRANFYSPTYRRSRHPVKQHDSSSNIRRRSR
ncbi:uncharacterized protein LOC124307246 [Neodiprion virginianus]|uniref:uncharacterized protein LOC124307246 n=1 Tax=Neodiprion virginianus TaxID=2961670 RepID=UPI001EE6F298|nr:uncharacterized protein LOC124307246 [Neodiprion virginianus]